MKVAFLQTDVSRENKDLEKTHFNDHSFDEEKLDGLQVIFIFGKIKADKEI